MTMLQIRKDFKRQYQMSLPHSMDAFSPKYRLCACMPNQGQGKYSDSHDCMHGSKQGGQYITVLPQHITVYFQYRDQ